MKIVLMGLLVMSAIYCMSVERVYPQENVLKLLKEFHKPTSSGYNDSKPDMSKFKQTGRRFIAKMDSFGLDRYFAFKTNDDVDALVKAVQQGQSMAVKWFFYETSENVVKVKKITEGVVFITDDMSD